jgi:predicted enzyme related to lactoylglutathione lyase
MATRLVHLVIDAADPAAAARFWAAALDWEIEAEEAGEVSVSPPGFSYPGPSALPLVFVPVSEPKTVKNRVHLDLASASPEHQAALVERVISLGASHLDLGQGDVPWAVLADPAGNEFCVLEPRGVYAGTGPVAAVVVDCADPEPMASFWAAAAGWVPGPARDGLISLRSADGAGPYLELMASADPKAVKNRVHLDVAPFAGGDTPAEAARLTELGATRADIGQGDVSWIVLADPDGQEFCVLSPR